MVTRTLGRIVIKPKLGGVKIARVRGNMSNFTRLDFARAASQCVAMRLNGWAPCRCLVYGEGGDLPPLGFSPFDCGER